MKLACQPFQKSLSGCHFSWYVLKTRHSMLFSSFQASKNCMCHVSHGQQKLTVILCNLQLLTMMKREAMITSTGYKRNVTFPHIPCEKEKKNPKPQRTPNKHLSFVEYAINQTHKVTRTILTKAEEKTM